MGFAPYQRLNLRDKKAITLAAEQYKLKLAVMRINLRAYRIQPVQPVAPTPPTNPQPHPQPQPQPQPQPPTIPTNNNGQVGIGGGSGPVPPAFPGGSVTIEYSDENFIAIGMPAPQPR